MGLGIAVVAFSMVVTIFVSGVIGKKARSTDSAALSGDAAHLRTDAMTSAGVLAGLVLVKLTGENWIDPVVALLVAASIVVTGVRLLTDSSRGRARGATSICTSSSAPAPRSRTPTAPRTSSRT